MKRSIDIEGKVAFITGANRGIGKNIAETFLKNGAKKIYAGVRNLQSADPLIEKYGARFTPIYIDLEKPETIVEAAKKAKDTEVVVNSAGVFRMTTPLDQDAVDTLQHEINIHAFGLIRIAQAFAPILRANGGGAFVQINALGSIKCFSDYPIHSASKAASYSLTQSLREILASQNTAVISVHPGLIQTDMAAKADLGEEASAPDVVSQGILKALKKDQFHLFPDPKAIEIGRIYQRFADSVIETRSNI